MINKKLDLGILGENIASEFIREKGYFIIERNMRQKWGELDIVARSKYGMLVFVEVKTMQENSRLDPEDNLTFSKIRKLKRTASIYAGNHGELIDDKIGWRIDLIAIDILDGSGKTNENRIRHYENI